MATMMAVQPKQPSFSVLPSSLSDFNGVRLTASVQVLLAKCLGPSCGLFLQMMLIEKESFNFDDILES